MLSEPTEKRVVAFIDGQNLFHAAKDAFGYKYPNYDPKSLAQKICDQKKWKLAETRFYTGVPSSLDHPFWHHFWSAKLAVMGTRQIHTFSRSLRYRNETIVLPDGTSVTALVGQEKGIDIRIALDIVSFARAGKFDVALVFSQDQDLSEVADEMKSISIQQKLWLKMACAFPISPTYQNSRGINGTEWFKIDRKMYDACIDKNDYRPKKS